MPVNFVINLGEHGGFEFEFQVLIGQGIRGRYFRFAIQRHNCIGAFGLQTEAHVVFMTKSTHPFLVGIGRRFQYPNRQYALFIANSHFYLGDFIPDAQPGNHFAQSQQLGADDRMHHHTAIHFSQIGMPPFSKTDQHPVFFSHIFNPHTRFAAITPMRAFQWRPDLRHFNFADAFKLFTQ